MKYLSLFEAYKQSISKDDIQDIKDMFLDISDEFNLEKVTRISVTEKV